MDKSDKMVSGKCDLIFMAVTCGKSCPSVDNMCPRGRPLAMTMKTDEHAFMSMQALPVSLTASYSSTISKMSIFFVSINFKELYTNCLTARVKFRWFKYSLSLTDAGLFLCSTKLLLALYFLTCL